MNLKKALVLVGAAALLFAAAGSLHAQVKLDPNLPDYKPVKGISGNIKSVGSDTMNNLMAYWTEGFHKMYPNVKSEVEGKGSSTAPPALIAGTATFGPMSRQLKDKENDEFETKFGYKLIQIPTSIDMLAVYVNKDNPIHGLTLKQADAIFSKTRKRGAENDARTWGDLGLNGKWADKPISIYGRNAASGTYGFFKEHVLRKGDYKDSVKEQPGSSAVVQGVARDLYAIGYSGIGYITADVRAVPLAFDESKGMVPATPANAYSGKYPLSRFLYLTVNKKPNEDLDPLRREFIRYVFSKQGQKEVLKAGYFPLSAKLAKKALSQVGIEASP